MGTTIKLFVSCAGRALQWRLLLLWAAAMLLPTALLALPIWQLLSASLDHSVHAATLARALDLTAITDLLAVHARQRALIDYAAVLALGLTLALSPLLTGMAAVAARSPLAAGFGALLRGALDEYPRMLRLLVWGALALGLVALAGHGVADAVDDYGVRALLAADYRLAARSAAIAVGVLALLVHVSLDAGRAALARDPAQRAAWRGWWQGMRSMAQRPVATLALYLGFGAVGAAAIALLALARSALAGDILPGWLGALLLTQLIVMSIGWMRVARLFALLELQRAAPARARGPGTRPLSQPVLA